MYLVFLLLWVVFNGKLTLEILLIGMVLCGLLFAFCCKFMDYSVRRDLRMFRVLPLICRYLAVLILEILKANGQVLHFIMTPKYQVEPQIVHFRSHLKTETARVVLANSITLTPGTITVKLEGQDFYVHCLDRDFAQGMEQSIFVELLEKMEAVSGHV